MGPRLARRGMDVTAREMAVGSCLQWVHGSLAVVSVLPCHAFNRK